MFKFEVYGFKAEKLIYDDSMRIKVLGQGFISYQMTDSRADNKSTLLLSSINQIITFYTMLSLVICPIFSQT